MLIGSMSRFDLSLLWDGTRMNTCDLLHCFALLWFPKGTPWGFGGPLPHHPEGWVLGIPGISSQFCLEDIERSWNGCFFLNRKDMAQLFTLFGVFNIPDFLISVPELIDLLVGVKHDNLTNSWFQLHRHTASCCQNALSPRITEKMHHQFLACERVLWNVGFEVLFWRWTR